MIDTKIEVLNYEFDNPVIPASGTFGFGYEFSDYYDINILGSISLKGTTLEARYGNPLPRIAEGKTGLINAIGLQNPGVDQVIANELPKLKKVFDKKVIANVGGHSEYEYLETIKKFNNVDSVLAVELNISCPNVSGGGMAFGLDKNVAYKLVSKVKAVSSKPIIVKLSPNVTNIVEMAQAVCAAGADAISLVNTFLGMRFDLRTGQPIIAVKKGGYSGPGIYPMALKMVYDVASVINVPVIGMGGIETAEDVIEMMSAGASLVMVGSANLVDPYACEKIIKALPYVMNKYGITSLKNIIGRSIK